MAVSAMQKFMIISHRTEAVKMLDKLQHRGICQILNAEQSIVAKDSPELSIASERPRDIEILSDKLTKTIDFLLPYTPPTKGLAAALAPRAVVDTNTYKDVIEDNSLFETVDLAQQTQINIEKLNAEIENIDSNLNKLHPWQNLQNPVEHLNQLRTSTALTGFLPTQHLSRIKEELKQHGAVLQQVGAEATKYATLIVCLNENLSDVQRLLRSADFEAVTFEGMTGTIQHLIGHYQKNLQSTKEQLKAQHEKATDLGETILKLQILADHYTNLLDRELTKSSAPATEQTIVFEGWVRKRDYQQLQKLVADFNVSILTKVEPAEGETVPIEIENKAVFRPFEVITRLYGMPLHLELDPTIFLAPFFALFFGLCLSDAGYGLLMTAGSVYFIKKTQGDKKFGYMLLICSIFTVICGALTGSWFGDAIQLINTPALNSFRSFFLKAGFDPSVDPMVFFAASLTLGYFQLMCGIAIAFVDKIIKKDYIAAVCDHLTWLIMLNLLVTFGFANADVFIKPEYAHIFLKLAAAPGTVILLFSHREGSIVARLGMGFYNLTSTMFYVGDTLSYVRLMALGMVTAGFASAINQMGILAFNGIKFVGPVLAVLVMLGLHSFNLGISALGAFVHSLRLQYVEFFPKFFVGGGRPFEPLSRQFKYIYINEKFEK